MQLRFYVRMDDKKRQGKAPVGRSWDMQIKNDFENAHLRHAIAKFDNAYTEVLFFIRNFLPEIDKSDFKLF